MWQSGVVLGLFGIATLRLQGQSLMVQPMFLRQNGNLPWLR